MSSWARVGVKCVSVNKKYWSDIRRPSGDVANDGGPAYGQVVTVRDTEIGPDGDFYISLMEYGDGEYFWVDRFRPLISQADDAAMFRALVDGMGPLERLDSRGELLDTTPSP